MDEIKTSISHPLQIAEVKASKARGRIGITFCPGKKQDSAISGQWDRDLDLDLDVIAAWGAVAVVTLVEDHELDALKVEDMGRKVAERHMDWLQLPISDVSTPSAAFEETWKHEGERLRSRLRDGFNILVHCKGGLGRAGMIAARLLAELGDEPSEAIAAVRRARHPGAIETREQERLVLNSREIAEVQPDRATAATMDRAVGAMLGLAVGDAVGTTLEFKSRNDRAERLTDMVGGGPFNLKPGQWTDDTSLAWALADSLHICGGFNASDLMDRFLSWWLNGQYSSNGRCFDIGHTTSSALRTFETTGNPFAGSTHPDAAGNGSLMRLAPIAIRYWNDEAERRRVAAEQSRTTHGAPEAVDACVVYSDILADAISGAPRSTVLASRTGDYAGHIKAIAAGSWQGKARDEIRGSGYVAHALEAALWCVGTTANFRDAVLMAANLREDADTTAAITGQLAGALYGRSGIPAEWLEKLAYRDALEQVASDLFKASV